MPHFWSQNALKTMTSWFTRFGPEALLNKKIVMLPQKILNWLDGQDFLIFLQSGRSDTLSDFHRHLN